MQQHNRRWIGLGCVLLLLQGIVFPQATSQLSGVFFADYYYNLENSDTAVKDQNAFVFRRIYFTFDNAFTENITVRFRLESEHGKFGSAEKVIPFVKHAYLEWKNWIPNHSLYLGISETNAFKNSETLWGYRSIEKTIMDLNKISSSADMGIALKGDLSKRLHHWFMVMNGTGYGSSEVDRFKKIGYALWVTPVPGLILEGYGDYENQDPKKANLSSAKDLYPSRGYYTLKGFVGLEQQLFSLGAEAFVRINQESGSLDLNDPNSKADVKRQGYSVFGSWITPIPRLKAFARYDYYDPVTDDNMLVDKNGKTGKDDENMLIIAGLDYIPKVNVHFMPNIVYKSYTKEGKKSDLTFRITLWCQFDSGKINVE